jgi:regulation of enolase protein 1 (concanavalin A-like superfamily)
MNFKIKRASYYGYYKEEPQPIPQAVKSEDGVTWEVEIGTVEELMAMIDQCGIQFIIGKENSIIIYDDYME